MAVLLNLRAKYSLYTLKFASSSCFLPGRWIESVQAYTQQYALYVANLIHQDTRSVIKVVRYGLNIQCYPNEHAVARQKERPREPQRPFWAE